MSNTAENGRKGAEVGVGVGAWDGVVAVDDRDLFALTGPSQRGPGAREVPGWAYSTAVAAAAAVAVAAAVAAAPDVAVAAVVAVAAAVAVTVAVAVVVVVAAAATARPFASSAETTAPVP